jgi:transcriptional regulator with XRE-family HTH domain
MPPRLGEIIKQARQSRRLTLRHIADQVMKEDSTPISPQYLFDIEVHHRVPAPRVLRELAWVLELDYDTLLALAGAGDSVVRDYLEEHPQHTDAVIKFFRAAQRQRFEDWDHLRRHIEHDRKGDS